MKRLNRIILMMMLVVFAGCEEYLDINDDPNNPTIAPIKGLVSTITFETGNNMFRVGNPASYYVQYLASPNPASALDTHERVNYEDEWYRMYDVMTDIADLKILAEEQNAPNYVGVAQLLEALHLGMTVDLWGDAPYSEAFFAEFLQPAYDDDQALYQQVLSLIDAGIANLQNEETNVSLGDDDFIYDGDVDKWIRFGYLLKARYLNHLPDSNAADILAALDNAYESNDDNATVTYFENEINPWADEAIDNENLLLGGWISEQLVQAMDGTTFGVVDPRMPYMFGPNDDGEFVGTENGAGRGNAPEQGARSVLVPGDYYTTTDGPVMIATFAEQKFIEAEAALASNSTRAYAAYLAGIEAHMDMLGVEEAEKEAYLTDPAVAVGAGNLTIDDIFREKYIVMFLNPESWVDARRYDYQYEDMTLPENHNPDLGNQFILRFDYPDSERNRNGLNIPAVSLGDPIFWDN